MNIIFFAFNAGLSATNAAIYADNHSPLSLAAAVFCGFVAAFFLVMMVATS